MLFTLLSLENNISYNIQIARVFGLYSAVFISFLITEQTKSITANTLQNNKYFMLSRKEIEDKTTLDDNKQNEIEENLIACNVLERFPVTNSSLKSYYYLNEQLLLNILSTSNADQINEVLKKSSIKKKELMQIEKPERISKRQIVIQALKNNVKEKDNELRQLFIDWIDAIYSGSGYLSKQGLQITEDELSKYCSDKKIKIEVLKIAIKNSYKDITFAINNFEKNKKFNTRSNENKTKIISSNVTDLENFENIKNIIESGKEGIEVF